MNLSGLIYGMAGGGVVGLISVVSVRVAIAYVKRLIAQNDELRAQQEAGLRREISELSSRLDYHIGSDRSQEMLNELRHLNSSMTGLTTQMTRVLETTAEQGRDIENNKAYIERLREDLQSHVKDCKRR